MPSGPFEIWFQAYSLCGELGPGWVGLLWRLQGGTNRCKSALISFEVVKEWSRLIAESSFAADYPFYRVISRTLQMILTLFGLKFMASLWLLGQTRSKLRLFFFFFWVKCRKLMSSQRVEDISYLPIFKLLGIPPWKIWNLFQSKLVRNGES